MLCFSDKDREVLRTSTPQALAEVLEQRRKALLEAVSERYLSIISRCKLIKEYNFETNIARVKEIALRITGGDDALRSNEQMLSKAHEVVQQVSLLLEIVRALAESSGDLYEMMGKLMFVKERRLQFRQNKFYNVVDRVYKSRLVLLSKRVESEIEAWQGVIRATSRSIFCKIMERLDKKRAQVSVIFNAMYDIRPMLCLSRVLVPLYVSREFNFGASPFPERFDTTEEMLSFALSLAFIKEKGIVVRGPDYRAMNVSQVRLVRRLFDKMGTCYHEIEDAERSMCMEILRRNEHLLETSVAEYVDACREAGYIEEQAETIDTFFCRKLAALEQNVGSVEDRLENLNLGRVEDVVLDKQAVPDVVERIRQDIEQLKSRDPLFESHRWNCESAAEKFVKRAEQNVFQAKKAAIVKICKRDGDVGQALVRELHGVEPLVAEMLCEVIRDGLRQRMTGDEKTRRRAVGDALVVVKFYRDSGIPAGVMEELLQ
eukprot:jgi/Antlo1/311/673